MSSYVPNVFASDDVAHLIGSAIRGEGDTIYRGRPKYAGRYIVGGIRTASLPFEPLTPTFENLVADVIRDFATNMEYVGKSETLGVWIDYTNVLHVDLGDTYYTLESALVVAAKRGELAIWDREERTEIRL